MIKVEDYFQFELERENQLVEAFVSVIDAEIRMQMGLRSVVTEEAVSSFDMKLYNKPNMSPSAIEKIREKCNDAGWTCDMKYFSNGSYWIITVKPARTHSGAYR